MAKSDKNPTVVKNDFGPVHVNVGNGEHVAVELPRDTSNDPAPPQPSEEDAFLEYVHGELTEVARALGYEIIVNRVVGPDDEFRGPTARYNRTTGEMRVFNSRTAVPTDYVSYEEYLELKKVP